MDEIIAAIEAARKNKHVSISELARRADTTRAYIHRVIKGQHKPTLAWCLRVAHALDLDITIQPTPVD